METSTFIQILHATHSATFLSCLWFFHLPGMSLTLFFFWSTPFLTETQVTCQSLCAAFLECPRKSKLPLFSFCALHVLHSVPPAGFRHLHLQLNHELWKSEIVTNCSLFYPPSTSSLVLQTLLIMKQGSQSELILMIKRHILISLQLTFKMQK